MLTLNKLIVNIRNKFCFEDKNIGKYKICNANIYKRFAAFLIDLFIILLIAVVLLGSFLNKNNVNVKKLNHEQINQEIFLQENIKILVKKTFNVILLTAFLYFFISNFYLKSTLGQKLFKLRIISVNNKCITNYELFNKALFIAFAMITANVFILLLFFMLPLLFTNYKVTLIDVITNTNIIELKIK